MSHLFLSPFARASLIGLLGCLPIHQVGAQSWSTVKQNVHPEVALTSEFGTPHPQALASLGWEDGVHISPDGLHLYCTYAPVDLLSFVLMGSIPTNFSTNYLRGAPTFGMDLTTNPLGASEWLHSDILAASRNTRLDVFSSWELSDMSRPFFSEGAPTPTFSTPATIELMAFTSNDNPGNSTDIWVIEETSVNPQGTGAPLPAPVNSEFNEDNPHIVRTGEAQLVLFFDSNDRPGGAGEIDLWYSTSADNGTNWTTPSAVTSINSAGKEHQPFLHRNTKTGIWHLYYAAEHADGKLAIFRARQQLAEDWNAWGTPELVMSAGNTAGIGEPTLTDTGDLSFVVIVEHPNPPSMFDRFDSDPWLLPSKPPVGELTLSFASQSGATHRVEYSTNLVAGSWMPATNLPGDGTQMQITFPTTHPAAYYRIHAEF